MPPKKGAQPSAEFRALVRGLKAHAESDRRFRDAIELVVDDATVQPREDDLVAKLTLLIAEYTYISDATNALSQRLLFLPVYDSNYTLVGRITYSAFAHTVKILNGKNVTVYYHSVDIGFIRGSAAARIMHAAMNSVAANEYTMLCRMVDDATPLLLRYARSAASNTDLKYTSTRVIINNSNTLKPDLEKALRTNKAAGVHVLTLQTSNFYESYKYAGFLQASEPHPDGILCHMMFLDAPKHPFDIVVRDAQDVGFGSSPENGPAFAKYFFAVHSRT